MNGSIARRDDAQYFFFVLLAILFRGIKPFNRCFAPSSFINDVMSQRAFVRTCRSTLVVQDMVAGYEPSVATAKCPESVCGSIGPSGRRDWCGFRVCQTHLFDNKTITPHFAATHLVRGYHISWH